MFEAIYNFIFNWLFMSCALVVSVVATYLAYVKQANTRREIWVRTIARVVFWLLAAAYSLVGALIMYFMVVLSLHYG